MTTFMLLLLLSAPQDQDRATAELKKRLDAAVASSDAWRARRKEIRERILVSAGLWPEFERPALKPVIFHRLERDGYTVEKVRIETLPGFHLTGNLYRPLGREGPFPAIVSPHGHWRVGRFVNEERGSIPGRCISLARMGIIVFAYDMVGYGDFKQLPHSFADTDWGLDLTGLQLWNSLRAVDFLVARDDVDASRIGATGASGGGTQTFLLTAVDDRIAVSAPVNMIAAEFQGGCSCENAPFLRIGVNNVEIGAMAAPRPFLLICCTGDWTKFTPKLEGPIIADVYKAHGVPDRFRFVQFDAPHNYNKDSREAMYAWMARWLLGAEAKDKLAEPEFAVESKEDVSVYLGEHEKPTLANAEALAETMRKKIRAQIEALRPTDASTMDRFRRDMTTALRHILTLRTGSKLATAYLDGETRRGGQTATVIAATDEASAKALWRNLKDRGELAYGVILKPAGAENASGGNDRQRKAYPTTFYRTPLSHQVSDIVEVLEQVAAKSHVSRVRLVGLEKAGIPPLLASALATTSKLESVVVDASAAGDKIDHPYLKRIDAVRTAAILASPRRLALYSVPEGFDVVPIRAGYTSVGEAASLTLTGDRWNGKDLLEKLK